MQSWLRLIGTGLMGGALAFACTVGDPDDDDNFDDTFDQGDDDEGGRAGSGAAGASAGKGGSGGSTAGSGGRAGGGAGGTTGGSSGSGGSAGDIGEVPDDLRCDGEGTEPAEECTFVDPTPGFEACQECLSSRCCDELKGCYATNPSDACGWGGVDGVPEYMCYIGCIQSAVEAAGGDIYDEEAPMRCALECGTPRDGRGQACGTPLISNRANDLVGCVHDNCEEECFFQ